MTTNSENTSAMENYHLVSQWAANVSADKAFKELLDFRARTTWAKLPESTKFLAMMYEDLPKILNIIKLQEKQNTILRMENQRLNDYITVNRMADELLLDEIKAKYPEVNI